MAAAVITPRITAMIAASIKAVRMSCKEATRRVLTKPMAVCPGHLKESAEVALNRVADESPILDVIGLVQPPVLRQYLERLGFSIQTATSE